MSRLFQVLALFLVSTLQAVVVGEKAPDFSSVDIYGQTIHLADYKGKIVVLEWTNPRSPFVRKHYMRDPLVGKDTLQMLQKTYTQPSVGVIWLCIASSSQGSPSFISADAWKAQLQVWGSFPTTVIMDQSQHIAQVYGARCTPEMFIIGRDGAVVYHGAIDSLRGSDPNEMERPDNLHWFQNALEQAVLGKRIVPKETAPYGSPL